MGQRHAAYRERNELGALRYTWAQEKYLRDNRPVVLWRDGNQIGKTTAALVDLIHRCRGTHPFHAIHKPPIRAIILSESWDQMGAAGGFQRKLWDLLPKDEIDPRISYDPGRGITGKPPRIVFVAGPGKGSVISLATFKQGPSRLKGPTVHFILTDEPPPPSVLEELMPRLLRLNGHLRINFTPTLDMPDQRWLRKLVTEGKVHEHNVHLKAANCWPQGAPFPWLHQGRIDEMVAMLPEAVRRMRVEGSWEPVLTGKWLTNFDAAKHVRSDMPPEGATLGIGIDHGTNAGKQAAILFATIGATDLEPYVWFLDEVQSDGMTNPREDAQAILAMLKRNPPESGQKLIWSDIDLWIGDRPTGESRWLIRKSNLELKRHLCALLKIPLGSFPSKPPHRIHTPNKKKYSVESGLHLMNAYAGTFDDDGYPHFVVNPRCKRFIEFCEKFVNDRNDPLKDMGDAGRYIMQLAVGRLPSMHLVRRY